MSGSEYVKSSAPPPMQRAMPQGQVTCSYLPLLTHASTNTVFASTTPRNRPKNDNSTMRIEIGDVLFMQDRFGDKFEPHGTQHQVRAFASHAGADYDLFDHTRVVGIAEEQFIPGNTPPTNLLSMSIRRVTSQRLRGQRKGTSLVVDYGTSLIASMPTYEEVCSDAITFLPETPRSTFVVRDLPIIEPLTKYTNQSIDLDFIFDRAVRGVISRQMHERTNLVNNLTQHGEDEGVWDRIDDDMIKNIRSQLLVDSTPEFCLLLGDDYDMRKFGSNDFFRIYAQQLHTQLASCVTAEDYLIAQQRTVYMQMVFNWEMFRVDSGRSVYKSGRDWSRLLASFKLLQNSVEAIMTLGQENIASKCKRLVGMAMGHGRYMDVVDIWFEPSMRR